VVKGLLSKHEALGLTVVPQRKKEHSKFKGRGKNSNINRSVGEVDSNSHEQVG
jgi:hypothetical protein